MGKRNQKKNKLRKQLSKTTLQENKKLIDENVLSQAIVNAYQIIEENKKKEEYALEKAAQKEWDEIIGQKKYPQNEKSYLKKFHKIRNDAYLIWNFLFFEPKNVKDMRTTMGLLQMAIISIFIMCKWFLYLVSLVAIYLAFSKKEAIISYLLFAFVSWIFARAFRIAVFEIEKMKDGNLLISLFSACTSFVAMVVAIIALFATEGG